MPADHLRRQPLVRIYLADPRPCRITPALSRAAAPVVLMSQLVQPSTRSFPSRVSRSSPACVVSAGQTGGLQFVCFLVFGTLMVLAGILAAALPETAGVATPETLNQAPQRSAAEDARLVRCAVVTCNNSASDAGACPSA